MRSSLAIDPNLNAPTDPLPVEHITQLDGLDRLDNASLDALVWRRQMPPSVSDWIDAIPASQLPESRYRLHPDQVERCVQDTFGSQGIDPCPSLQWLADDIQNLAQRVAKLLQTPTIRLRLEPVSYNACSKFHIDKVVARLICTYRGPGTQVCVAPDAPDSIESISTGLPILLKGRLWDQQEALTLMHRSPPISGTGITRWMVVIEGAAIDDGLFQYDQLYLPQA